MGFCFRRSNCILILQAFGLLICLSACADEVSKSSLTKAQDTPDSLRGSSDQLMGTQIGNPIDPYPNMVRVLINEEVPSSEAVTIHAEDTFTCDSQIDLGEFEQDLNQLGLTLTYFIKVTNDHNLVRNFMHQVRGSAIVHYFGAGSNLILVCQAIIYTSNYQTVYNEFSAPLTCSNCGQSNSGGE